MCNVNCVILWSVRSVITPAWNAKYVNVLIPFWIEFSVRLYKPVSVEGIIEWLFPTTSAALVDKSGAEIYFGIIMVGNLLRNLLIRNQQIQSNRFYSLNYETRKVQHLRLTRPQHCPLQLNTIRACTVHSPTNALLLI